MMLQDAAGHAAGACARRRRGTDLFADDDARIPVPVRKSRKNVHQPWPLHALQYIAIKGPGLVGVWMLSVVGAQLVVVHPTTLLSGGVRGHPCCACATMAGYKSGDWWKLAKLIPCGPSAGDTKARKAMFRNMDVNGNGLLSVMEVERSTQKLLGEVNENFLHADLAAAFESAKTAHISRDKNLNNTLDLLEFRQFLGDVKQGFYNRFVDAIYTEGDGRMNVKEYVRFVNQLGVWGVDVPDAEQVYKDIDSERRGVIFWEEIKEWLSTVATDFDEAAISEAEQADTLGGGSIKMSADGTIMPADEASDQDLTNDIDLPDLISKLPAAKYLKRDEELRKTIWFSFDVSGNGSLALVEVEDGLTRMLATNGSKYVHALSPAIKRAFAAAKDATGEGDATSVTRGEEFRLLLVYLKRYFELLVAFDRIDTTDDRKMDRSEFDVAIPMLGAWGVSVDNPDTSWTAIDADGSGMVIFDEFAKWALDQGLDMDPSDNVAGEAELAGRHVTLQESARNEAKHTAARVAELDRRASIKTGTGDGTGKWHANLDLSELVRMLPAGDDPADEGRSRKLFEKCDINNNGFLVLSEVSIGLSAHLGTAGKEIVQGFAPAIRRAYLAALPSETDAMSHAAFKELLVYLKLYIELLVVFDQIDTSDDRRVDFGEFQIALPLIQGWGVHVADPQGEFARMDADKGGQVLFVEFAGWALQKGLDVWRGRAGGPKRPKAMQLKREETMSRLAEKHAEIVTKEHSPPTSPTSPGRRRPSLKRLLALTADTSLAQLLARVPSAKEDTDARRALFTLLDVRNDGAIVLADIEDGLRTLLSEARGGAAGDDVTSPALADAFHAATRLEPVGERYITKATFRDFLCNLRWYHARWHEQARPPATPRPGTATTTSFEQAFSHRKQPLANAAGERALSTTPASARRAGSPPSRGVPSRPISARGVDYQGTGDAALVRPASRGVTVDLVSPRRYLPAPTSLSARHRAPGVSSAHIPGRGLRSPATTWNPGGKRSVERGTLLRMPVIKGTFGPSELSEQVDIRVGWS